MSTRPRNRDRAQESIERASRARLDPRVDRHLGVLPDVSQDAEPDVQVDQEVDVEVDSQASSETPSQMSVEPVSLQTSQQASTQAAQAEVPLQIPTPVSIQTPEASAREAAALLVDTQQLMTQLNERRVTDFQQRKVPMNGNLPEDLVVGLNDFCARHGNIPRYLVLSKLIEQLLAGEQRG